MFYSIIILFISIGIGLLEIPKLLRGKLVRESLFYLLILSIGTFFCILLALDINLPNPVNWLTILFKPLTNWLNFT
ncbi:hypothetical protein [Neobacillus drentensis]|uniref:hypothetical protein n=1 Tax=Neobacillus drentensis TaxID=220684 RepID=UPI002FFE34A0